jgi:hypothetical protein
MDATRGMQWGRSTGQGHHRCKGGGYLGARDELVLLRGVLFVGVTYYYMVVELSLFHYCHIPRMRSIGTKYGVALHASISLEYAVDNTCTFSHSVSVLYSVPVSVSPDSC